MKASLVRKTFLDFFESKSHLIVPSAPMVVKDDPTLMFTNAGMNQFKDIFLGHVAPQAPRIADTQKCLRVSGKHNDLDEVGLDTYHHTMFEMLGNWSFGDYFKKEAIEWAWELLTGIYGIDKDRLYVSVFTGDPDDGLPRDDEALEIWKSLVAEDRVIMGSKKDNFWEMGDTGPCGPCSEIHVDLREETERLQIPGKDLVNKGHPLVMEVWNLVFIQYNRTAGGKLVSLPQKHIDTGMGFERLCMVLQGKKSNYDTDVFQPIIARISSVTGIPYGKSDETDIAIRVVADHLRAITFAIADGQLPSNTGAGYVIRRILRRAVRYGFTFLKQKEPFVNELVPVLVKEMGDFFPEIRNHSELIRKVITEEEVSFLRTLSTGIRKFEQYLLAHPPEQQIDGQFAFELFDTFGFPVDLTQLMAREKGTSVDMEAYQKKLEEQKERSRQATQLDTDDWIILTDGVNGRFVGYDTTACEVRISRYRRIKSKGKESYQLMFDQTPFYAESGGQVGDTGTLTQTGISIPVIDTRKEGNLTVHFTDRLPADPLSVLWAEVNESDRMRTARNHSATHLLHHALRYVLGPHVEQKGSYVGPDHLRFDFSHFHKVNDEELARIEGMVNMKIRQNITLEEKRSVLMDEAIQMGALAFFGEKYGERVRVIRYGDSIELCGGTHVKATGQIGMFRIVSESAIAAGIRRIEAITGDRVEAYLNHQAGIVREIKTMLKNTQDVVKGVQTLMDQNNALQKKLEELQKEKMLQTEASLLKEAEPLNGTTFIGAVVNLDAGGIRDLAFRLKQKIDDLVLILGSATDEKVVLTIMLSDMAVETRKLHAGNLIRLLATEIGGGGGGQAHFATAGGSRPEGLDRAIGRMREIIVTQS